MTKIIKEVDGYLIYIHDGVIRVSDKINDFKIEIYKPVTGENIPYYLLSTYSINNVFFSLMNFNSRIVENYIHNHHDELYLMQDINGESQCYA